MSGNPGDVPRRTVLQGAAGLAVAASVATPAGAGAGDFAFLTGEWRIANRRLKTPGTDDWDEFEGEATVWAALNGVASIEELRIPSRNFAGMGVRVFDLEKRLWADHWVNARAGVVNPPMMGSFAGGVGTFLSDEMDGDKPIKARGVWDRVTPASCRWHQATSSDGGVTWDANWFMDWNRR